MLIYSDENVSVYRSDLQETASTVIQSRESVIVVDPAWLPAEIEKIRNDVENILNGRKLYLLFTHSDFDHIIGYKAFPGAKVIASSGFAGSTEAKKQIILAKLKAFDDENYLSRPYEPSFPHVDLVVGEDGDSMALNDLQLTFYNAPGHNDDGLFTIIEPLGIMLSGDYYCNVEFPYIYYSGVLYEQTLAKLDHIMDRFDLKMLIPGHGDLTTDQQEMKNRKITAQNYITSLRELIKTNHLEEMDQLIKGYQFPTLMKKMNRDNMVLLKKEMGL